MKKKKVSSRSVEKPVNKERIEGADCSNDIEYVYEVQQRKAEAYDRRALARVADPLSPWFGGLDPRRRQEVADAGMIRPDLQEMANCPRKAIHHEWPRVSYYQNPYIDDIVVGE